MWFVSSPKSHPYIITYFFVWLRKYCLSPPLDWERCIVQKPQTVSQSRCSFQASSKMAPNDPGLLVFIPLCSLLPCWIGLICATLGYRADNEGMQQKRHCNFQFVLSWVTWGSIGWDSRKVWCSIRNAQWKLLALSALLLGVLPYFQVLSWWCVLLLIHLAFPSLSGWSELTLHGNL